MLSFWKSSITPSVNHGRACDPAGIDPDGQTESKPGRGFGSQWRAILSDPLLSKHRRRACYKVPNALPFNQGMADPSFRHFLLKNHPIYNYRKWQLVSCRAGDRLEEAIPLSEANCKNFWAKLARSEAFAWLCWEEYQNDQNFVMHLYG